MHITQHLSKVARSIIGCKWAAFSSLSEEILKRLLTCLNSWWTTNCRVVDTVVFGFKEGVGKSKITCLKRESYLNQTCFK